MNPSSIRQKPWQRTRRVQALAILAGPVLAYKEEIR